MWSGQLDTRIGCLKGEQRQECTKVRGRGDKRQRKQMGRERPVQPRSPKSRELCGQVGILQQASASTLLLGELGGREVQSRDCREGALPPVQPCTFSGGNLRVLQDDTKAPGEQCITVEAIPAPPPKTKHKSLSMLPPHREPHCPRVPGASRLPQGQDAQCSHWGCLVKPR